MMKDWAGSDDPSKTVWKPGWKHSEYLSYKKVSIPVDINVVKQNGTVNEKRGESGVQFEIKKDYLFKMMLR